MLSRLGILDLILLGAAAFIAISFLVRRMKAYQDHLIEGIRRDLDDARNRKQAQAELTKHQEKRRKKKEEEEEERKRHESRMGKRSRRTDAADEASPPTVPAK